MDILGLSFISVSLSWGDAHSLIWLWEIFRLSWLFPSSVAFPGFLCQAWAHWDRAISQRYSVMLVEVQRAGSTWTQGNLMEISGDYISAVVLVTAINPCSLFSCGSTTPGRACIPSLQRKSSHNPRKIRGRGGRTGTKAVLETGGPCRGEPPFF